MNDHPISLMIWLPLLGVVAQAFDIGKRAKWSAFACSLLSSLFAFGVVATMQPQQAGTQAAESVAWVSSYAINYDLGIDGLSGLFVILVAITFPLIILSEWKDRPGLRGMHSLFLLLQSAFFGALCAQDMFLQFFFWGLTAFPFYFLIGVWGGRNRETASFRVIATASIGNMCVLAALVLVYYSVDPHSFAISELSGGKLAAKTFEIFGYDMSVSTTAFVLIALGTALRLPIWPFQGWFTFAAKESPASVFALMTCANAPVTMYLFMRLGYALFPETLLAFSGVIVVVGLVNLVAGGLCMVGRRDFRSLLAYLSIAETGLVLVGAGSLNSAGAVGAVYQQFMLGLGMAGFALLAGVVFERAGHEDFVSQDGVKTFGALAASAPLVAVVAGVVIASLLGLPGSGGFVGKSLLVIGSYMISPAIVIVAGFAGLLAVYCLFGMYGRVFLGAPGTSSAKFSDLNGVERAYLLPILFLLLFFGLYPKPFVELVRPTVLTLLSTVK